MTWYKEVPYTQTAPNWVDGGGWPTCHRRKKSDQPLVPEDLSVLPRRWFHKIKWAKGAPWYLKTRISIFESRYEFPKISVDWISKGESYNPQKFNMKPKITCESVKVWLEDDFSGCHFAGWANQVPGIFWFRFALFAFGKLEGCFYRGNSRFNTSWVCGVFMSLR